MRTVAFAAIAILALAPGLLAQNDIVREGTGDHRDRLNDMELKPFPAKAWSHLDSWTTEEPLTPDATAGKVVLVFTWASWYPPSTRMLPKAQKLYDTHRDDGLIVLGVHHQRGWEGAVRTAESRGVTFPVAHDAQGKFAEALLVDQDPDFYLIDRGGNLRFADIAAKSLDRAVAALIEETRSEASDLPALLARREAQRRAAQERTQGINPELARLADIPRDLPFPQPADVEYQAIDEWRVLNEDMLELLGHRTSRRSDNDELVHIPMTIPETGIFYPERPATAGRLVAVYFWHPEVRSSYWPTMNETDLLQREYARDVVFIGVMVPRDTLLGNRRSRRDEADETPLELQAAFARFTRLRDSDHTLMLDTSGALLESFGGRRGRAAEDLARMMILTSSDGIVRWVGRPARVESPIDGLLRIDPGVQARRKAEQAYIDGRR